MARPRGAFDLEVITVVVIEPLEGLDDQVVDGKPHRSAPIGVSSEQTALSFGGLVTDGERLPVQGDAIGLGLVHFRDRADAVGGEKLLLVRLLGARAYDLGQFLMFTFF